MFLLVVAELVNFKASPKQSHLTSEFVLQLVFSCNSGRVVDHLNTDVFVRHPPGIGNVSLSGVCS